MRWICRECGKSFISGRELELHLRKKHKITKWYDIMNSYDVNENEETIDDEKKLGDG